MPNIMVLEDFEDLLLEHGVLYRGSGCNGPCPAQPVNAYILYQIERWISARGDSHIEVSDQRGKPAWWVDCAKECAPTGCTGGANDTQVAVPSKRHKVD